MQSNLDFLKQVTDKAIQRAVDHADAVHNAWSDRAYEFLVEFIRNNPSFMTEDVRYAAQGIVLTPPSLRAWGSVIRRAVKAGLIKHVAYRNVKNINAHSALASVWHRV